MMTAYEVINRNGGSFVYDEAIYKSLVKEFATDFLEERNYDKKVELHRNPLVVRNEILQEVYSNITKLQWRDEMRHIETKNEIVSSGYVNSKVKEIFEADKRMLSQFNAIQEYCNQFSKDIKLVAAHMAEFDAMLTLADQIRKSIHESEKIQNPSKASEISEKKKRASIPRKIYSRLLKEVGNKCPFCTFDDPAHLKVHHIDEDRSHADPERLILVCGICHDKIHAGEISKEAVIKMKEIVTTTQRVVPTTKSKIKVTSKNTNIQTGDHTTIKISAPKKVVQKYPPGCIGHDSEKRNYISYLVNQYHIFKEYDEGKENMNYAIFPSHLKKKFKTGQSGSIYNLPTKRFEELYKYIQQRINATTLAKIKGPTHRKYDSFEEQGESKVS